MLAAASRGRHRAAALAPLLVRATAAPLFTEPPAQEERAKAASFYDHTVEQWASMPTQVLTLERMMAAARAARADPSRLLASARYVQRELPKRLARRLLDLQLLPYIVVTNPHIGRVYTSYYHAFEALRALPPVETHAQHAAFCVMLRRLVDEHGPLLGALAQGLREARAKPLVGPTLQLDPFLDAMLRSRISRRVMAEQHLALVAAAPGTLGLVHPHIDVAEAVEFAAQRTAQVCAESYGTSPEVRISGDVSALLPYIPAHLDYMLHELLKNAMRAVVEEVRQRSSARAATSTPLQSQPYAALRAPLPPVSVRICEGDGVLVVRISDQGGGIPSDMLDQVFTWGFSTIPEGSPDLDALPVPGSSTFGTAGSSAGGATTGATAFDAAAATAAPADGGAVGFGSEMTLIARGALAPQQRYKMAGLGFGLPLARLYARFFGGDLRLFNTPGHGVDAYLTVRRLDATHWAESADELTAAAAAATTAMREQRSGGVGWGGGSSPGGVSL